MKVVQIGTYNFLNINDGVISVTGKGIILSDFLLSLQQFIEDL